MVALVNDGDGRPTQRLSKQPRNSGTYSITRPRSEDSTKISVTHAGDDLAITIDGRQLTLTRAAAKRLVIALLEVVE